MRNIQLPQGKICPIGYILLCQALRYDRPVRAIARWMAEMPTTYARAVLNEPWGTDVSLENDPNCIAKLRDYWCTMSLARDARKPIFSLKPGDGARGAHQYDVGEAYKDFKSIAGEIARRVNLPAP